MTLTLNAVIPFFTLDPPAYDTVLSNQVWLQTAQKFKNTVKIVIFDYISPGCDLDTKDSEQIFPHDTLPHNNTSQYQVWLKMVEWFRRY